MAKVRTCKKCAAVKTGKVCESCGYEEKRGGGGRMAGRRKNEPETQDDGESPRKQLATKILDSLGKDNGHVAGCWCQECLWRADAKRSDTIGQTARKYLWDRADGKPMDTVNHLHDKPLEMNVTLSMSEIVREVRERKQEYERSRK